MTTVTITTAVTLSSKQLETIEKSLSAKYGSDMTAVQVVDLSVIGGVKLLVNSTQVDATLKSKFDQLRAQVTRTV